MTTRQLTDYRTICPVCKRQFEAVRKGHVYCSHACRNNQPSGTFRAGEEKWHSMDLSQHGGMLLWRHKHSKRIHSKHRWFHTYEFELTLANGKVVKQQIEWEHEYATEKEIKQIFSMMANNMMTSIEGVVSRMK